jgi:hypothetical protein
VEGKRKLKRKSFDSHCLRQCSLRTGIKKEKLKSSKWHGEYFLILVLSDPDAVGRVEGFTFSLEAAIKIYF